MNNKFLSVFAAFPLLGVICLTGSAAVPVKTTKPPQIHKIRGLLPSAPLAGAPLKASVPAYLLYTYHGINYRDPFVPLLGEARVDETLNRPPQIASLSLKGLVHDAKGRMALLTSGINSYILRGGRLYDGRARLVPGISGVVKAQSVLLIGRDHTVKELKLKAGT